jgi:hypothetical protein
VAWATVGFGLGGRDERAEGDERDERDERVERGGAAPGGMEPGLWIAQCSFEALRRYASCTRGHSGLTGGGGADQMRSSQVTSGRSGSACGIHSEVSWVNRMSDWQDGEMAK